MQTQININGNNALIANNSALIIERYKESFAQPQKNTA